MFTPREQQIIDLREAGWSYPRIAQELGIKVETVRWVWSRAGGSVSVDLRHARAMERGSRDLLARIKHARGL